MFRFRRKKIFELDPDEVFLDAHNSPQFERERFEGTIEKALSKRVVFFIAVLFVSIGLLYAGRAFYLQVYKGQAFAARSSDNSLRQISILPDRGTIFDRNGEPLAWNNLAGQRIYSEEDGLAHIIGYIGLPEVIEPGTPPDLYIGKAGVEKSFEEELRGVLGVRIEEVDALGESVSENVQTESKAGDDINLSIDSKLQSVLYNSIENFATERGFRGGAGVIMNVNTGEILALTSYPEYDLNALVSGDNPEVVQSFIEDERTPFLNRVVSGLYAPGSTVKPYVGVAALEEKIISPNRQILSTGSITVPNIYNPDAPSVFTDWKAHGLVDLRKALAVSSNVYFYEVGGGYEDQEGLGIEAIEAYMRLFGFAKKTGIEMEGEEAGVIPNPEWKAEVFDGDIWRLGDTYFTAIGQFGFQVTPIQMVRAVAALANDGTLVDPKLEHSKGYRSGTKLSLGEDSLKVIREGMRLGVTDGIAQALNIPEVRVAAKTGTAELGTSKKNVNSWITGFFPYEDPEYAFVVVMEKGPSSNTVGASAVMRKVFDWMVENDVSYIK